MQQKYLRWIETGLFLGGVFSWGFSVENEIAWMTTAGVTLTGMGLMLGGVMAMSTGELAFFRSDYGITQDRGITARLFGFVLTLNGGGLLLYAATRLLGWDDRLTAILSDRPGYIMLAAGVTFTALGAANLTAAWNRRGSFISVFRSLGNWLGGILFLILGLSLIGIGLYEWAAPESFNNLIESIFTPFT